MSVTKVKDVVDSNRHDVSDKSKGRCRQ